MYLDTKNLDKEIEDINRLNKESKRFLSSRIIKRVNSKKKTKRLIKSNTKRRKSRRKRNNKIPKSYERYMKSTFWTKRRNLFFQRFPRMCCICGNNRFIELHHLKYDNSNFGKELDRDLIPVCKEHHDAFHLQFGSKKDMTDDFTQFFNDNYIPH